MRTELFRTSILSFALLACAGDKDGTDTDGVDTDTDNPVDTDDTDAPPADTFDITGNAIDVATQAPAAEGLCVRLLDPTPAISGGESLELGSGTLAAGGAYSFTAVDTTSQVGLLVEVADCAAPNTTVYTSSTGISYDSYKDLAAGAVLSGVQSFSINMTLLAGMQASAELIGFGGDLEADGMLFGFVVDSVGTPLADAAVTCSNPACDQVFYMDADSADGLFTTAGVPNNGTVVAGGSAFMIPAAPITQYEAQDGGVHTFSPVLIGSNPGIATIAAFFGE